jgi:NAD(P)-dependent dehydrogenase (short-subunit alcohol dehydrogenase family)
MDDFGDRAGVALVTGGSGGLGAAICRMLAARGSDVVLTYRAGEARAQQVVDDVVAHGRRAQALPVDLTDDEAAGAVVAQAAAEFGGIHTLVHAAGPTVPQLHLSKVSPAQLREAVDQEVGGFFAVAQPALPHLRAAAALAPGAGSGSLVAVTTAATHRFPVRDGLSSGPKAAIESLVRALAAEEGRFGVRANCVGPGMLTDGMAERLMASGDLDDAALEVTRGNIALRRFGTAIDVAEAVCFLASDRANFVSGVHLLVDGGYGI